MKNLRKALQVEIRLSTKKIVDEINKEACKNTNKILRAINRGRKKIAELNQKTIMIAGQSYTRKELIEKLK